MTRIHDRLNHRKPELPLSSRLRHVTPCLGRTGPPRTAMPYVSIRLLRMAQMAPHRVREAHLPSPRRSPPQASILGSNAVTSRRVNNGVIRMFQARSVQFRSRSPG